ncbi:MAG: hypothetical protein ACR2PL_01080 [Dehalococcoidia bacterium]
MEVRVSGRPHSARRSQPSGVTAHAGKSRSNGVIDKEDRGTVTLSHAFERPLPELPGRDGLDFRHPGYHSAI